jgi:hypothetical protein
VPLLLLLLVLFLRCSVIVGVQVVLLCCGGVYGVYKTATFFL